MDYIHSIRLSGAAIATRLQILHSFKEVTVSLAHISKLPLQVADRDVYFCKVDSQCDLLRSE